MALVLEWLPEEWPVGIPNLKQLLVAAPLTTSILLLFGCGDRKDGAPAHPQRVEIGKQNSEKDGDLKIAAT